MTQPTHVSLMRQPGEANPRYEAEAAELKAQLEPEKTGQSDPVTSTEQTPNHDWEKRYKDLQSYHSKTTNQLKSEIDGLKNQATPKFIPPKTEEELRNFQTENPETYAFIQTIANDMAQRQVATFEGQLTQVNHTLMETKIQEASLAIQAAHPDWETIREANEFHAWGAAQDDVVKGWLYDNPDNAQDAIRAISLFKADTGWGRQTTQETTNVPAQAAQHVDIRGNTSLPNETDRNHPAYIWKDSEIAKMRPEEFGQWQEVINLAVREGRYAQGQ